MPFQLGIWSVENSQNPSVEGHFCVNAPHQPQRPSVDQGLGSVEFRSVYSWALRFLGRRGIHPEVDAALARRAFDKAWREVGRSLSIADLGVPVEYWWEEIQSVIKGRGPLGPDDYLNRPGSDGGSHSWKG